VIGLIFARQYGSRGEDQSLCLDYAPLAVHLKVEVGIVLTVLTVDEALQHVCALFREQADRGSITLPSVIS